MPKGVENTWPSDEEILATAERLNGVIEHIARDLGVVGPTLRHHLHRRGLMDRVRELGANAKDPQPANSITSTDPLEWGDIEKLMRTRGFDTQDWVIVRNRIGEWGWDPHNNRPYTQLRVDLEPRALTLMPARAAGWTPPRTEKPRPARDTELTFLISDHHCPQHSRPMHERVVSWLRKHKPDRGLIMGDLLDLDAVSRHREDPERSFTVQTCIDSAYHVVRDYVWASPGTDWALMPGNHEDRLRNAVVDNLRGVYGLTQAKAEGEQHRQAVLSTTHLLRLDELGVSFVDPRGEYFKARYKLDDDMTARHGAKAAKGAGQSVRKHIDDSLHSTAMGHTHRQALHYRAGWTPDGDMFHLIGVEVGCAADISQGLGYADDADWANGFATLTRWPDGHKHVELARYDGDALMWRGDRW